MTETSKQNTTAEEIVELMKKVDFDTAKQVFEILNKEKVFSGCAIFTCQTKNHGEVGNG